MARVTVEDCIDKVENRFDLVLLASHRARMISSGSQITVERDDRILVVVALNGNLRPGRDHARPVARQKDEIEAVLNLVDAIFYGDTGHRLVTPLNGTLS